ncbi:MAG TPA: Uma2 family endonuclease [Oscillatoriales cyanobacterium M59_W2019_021]|nr:MAG: Uma2 family endonuclease [Cyanobacteria bacterium J055]HIK30159.1 Uma2 family endonuclease [Oscillatoriales cyanobacterium M4454_W2019_049]HIK52163.1 Uma2 family endonuclease [Oscillatoriales cyanobacterium M59_W2019_021]
MVETALEILPLENGDRLTRSEFERRYEAMPHVKKAELIEGIVYMGSPVRIIHGQPHALVMTWLGTYWTATPGLGLGDNTTVRLDADNEPQPDALLRIEVGGQSVISADGYVEGAPELIVEVAASSAAYDLHDKKRVYRRNGVREYVVWRVRDRQIDWFSLQEGNYELLSSDGDGIIRSAIFPGLWLAVADLLEGNMMRVLAVLQQGIASSEHQEFVRELGDTPKGSR